MYVFINRQPGKVGGQELQPGATTAGRSDDAERTAGRSGNPEPERSLLSRDRYGKLLLNAGKRWPGLDEKGTMITLYGERNLGSRKVENAIYAARAGRSSYGNMGWEVKWNMI